MHSLTSSLSLALVAITGVKAFYLPGVAPTTYHESDIVPVYVNTITPSLSQNDQQLRSVISYDYYDPHFHFCQPPDGPVKQRESLGSILFGDRIFSSPLELTMLHNSSCNLLCKTTVPAAVDGVSDGQFINEKIAESYSMNWLIDGLPAARIKVDPTSGERFYSVGFELGSLGNAGTPLLNTHYDIVVEYHRVATDAFRVVGFIVQPSSKAVSLDAQGNPNCETDRTVVVNEQDATEIIYTYSVEWRYSNQQWATRWDQYLHVFDPRIHWFSLVNSAVIVIFLTGMVAMVLLRALHKDIARYNQMDMQEDVQEDSGWKLVHGDVFRPPKRPLLLSVLLGSGSQLFMMVGATTIFALLGFLSPSNRGALATVMIILYVLFGSIGGFVSSYTYKNLGGENWKLNIALTPILVPGVVFGTFIFLNFFLIAAHSSGAVPIGTMFAIVLIWFLISVPLSVAGSFFGFRRPILDPPVRTNQIPRQIPEQVVYLRPIPSILLSGVLPFGAIFVELYFIMNSIWFHKAYYMFGFLFVCYFIMIITCATVTILLTYFALCSENYHWWWRAFFTAGASSLYIFLHSLLYWTSKLSLGGFTSNVLYLGYSLLLTFLYFILTGTIGFVATYFFIRKIYGSIKID